MRKNSRLVAVAAIILAIQILCFGGGIAQQVTAVINQITTVAAAWTFGSGDLIVNGGSGSGCVQAASGVLSVTGSNCNTNSPGNVTIGAAVSGCGANGYVLYNNASVVGCEPASGSINPFGMPAYTTGASIWYSNPYVTGAGATSNTGTANYYYCSPFWTTGNVTIKALGLTVITPSTGNSSAALQGAIYSDLLTTANVHRPGALVDYTANFATGTGSGTNVSAAMNNTTDVLAGPALYWTCVQKFDATAAFEAITGTGSLISASIGSATLSNVLYQGSGNKLEGVSTSGSAYGGSNWSNFTSSTGWTEQTGTPIGPAMAIQVN
jgi:hypothetical protein